MSTGGGRPCTICGHPLRAEIDRRLLAAESLRKVARDTGTSPQSLQRHLENHISRSIAAAVEREAHASEEARDQSLLEQARDLQRKALGLMAKAYQAGDLRGALSGVSAATKLIEVQGKLLGQIGAPTINVLVTQEFKTVQVAILGALEDHPAARSAVLKALERLS